MGNRYNFFYFEAEFKKYLVAGKAEASTVKNYLSDLHFFFSWVQNSQQLSDIALNELSDVFTHTLIHSYYGYLNSAASAQNTTLRRFASLRKFFSLCIEQQWIRSNPVDAFDTHTKQDEREDLIQAYKKSLESKQYTQIELARHINVIRDLVINSQQL